MRKVLRGVFRLSAKSPERLRQIFSRAKWSVIMKQKVGFLLEPRHYFILRYSTNASKSEDGVQLDNRPAPKKKSW